jgi:hypothetical protein
MFFRNKIHKLVFGNSLDKWEIKASNHKDIHVEIDQFTQYNKANTILIESKELNHIRISQYAIIKEKTYYALKGFIKTENVQCEEDRPPLGAALAIESVKDLDWPILGMTQTFHGTNTWKNFSHIFYSGDHKVVLVQATLGMYSMRAKGKAWFSNIELIEVEDVRN